MKILFLATRYPYPTTKGDQLRVHNFLQQLVEQGHQVDFVCSAETDPNHQALASHFPSGLNRIIVCGFGRLERYVNLLRPFFTLQPFQVAYFFNRQMSWQIQRLLGQQHYDAIFCQMVRTAPYISSNTSAVKILDFQDAYSLNMYKRYRSEKGLVKWVAWLEWHLLAKYEQRLLRDFDQTTIISDRDRAVIGDSRIQVINNGVVTPSVVASTSPGQIVFSGNLQYFPNREAAVWFAQQVFPLIRQQQSTATLKLTGATPPADVLALADIEGVEVVANPANMAAEIASAHLAVAPMLSGSGLQNKVLEAMAVGVPVVLTSHALEGLHPAAQQATVQSSTQASAMAQTIIDLLNDQSRCQALKQAGLAYIEQHHSWSSIGKSLDRIITRPIGNKD